MILVLFWRSASGALRLPSEPFGEAVDPGIVVIDEVVGMIVTMMFIPVTTFSIVAGFLVFRVLDIVKPWPLGAVRTTSGWRGHHGRRRDGGDCTETS